MNQPPPVVPPKKSGGCLKGCLIAVGIVLILSTIAAYFVVKNIGSVARQLSSAGIDAMTDELLKEGKLDPAETAKVNAVVKGFTTKIRNGEVGVQQGIEVMKRLGEGPFIPYIIAASFHAVYLVNSTLPQPEIQAGRVTIGRFMQGIVQQSIKGEQSGPILDLFSTKKGSTGNNRDFKKHLSDDEIREILVKMKAAADAVNIPAVPMEIDVANELQKAINAGLKG